jgi:hypothetical protein
MQSKDNHVYIVRRSAKWLKYDTIDDPSFDHYWLQKRNKLQEVWSQTFNVSYINFRKKINNIRENNLKQLKFKKIISFYDDQKIKNILAMPNQYVYFTDDDDWYHDDIIEIINSYSQPIYTSFVWKPISFHMNRLFDATKFFMKYNTNNYVLKTPLKFSNINYWSIQHHQTNLIYEHSQDKLEIFEMLSIYNWNLGSVSKWNMDDISSSVLIKRLDLCRKEPNSNFVPQVFHKYIDQMLELYRKIKIIKL